MDKDIFKVGDRVRLTERSRGNFTLHPAPGTEGMITQCDGDGYPYVKWDHNENGWPVTAVKQERLQRVVSVPKLEHKILIMQDRDDPFTVVAKDLSTGKVGYARCAPEDTFHFDIGALIALGRLFGHEPEITSLKPEEKMRPAPCKFKVGDKIIGNENANRYGVTREGWVGEVTEVFPGQPGGGCDEGHVVNMWVKPLNDTDIKTFGFAVSDDAFDLYTPLYNGKVVCIESGIRHWTAGVIYPVTDGVIRDDDGDARYGIESVEDLNERQFYAKFIALKE